MKIGETAVCSLGKRGRQGGREGERGNTTAEGERGIKGRTGEVLAILRW